MKSIKLLALLTIAFIFAACGDKKITVKGADGTEYKSYQECCAAQDFQAAHHFLIEMQNSISEKHGDEKYEAKRELQKAKEEVFKQEALFLMSLGDEAANKRIIYLLKEEGDDDNRIDMLIDLAIDADDEDFVKQLSNQYNRGYREEFKKICEYLTSKDSHDNNDYLKSLLIRTGNERLYFDFAVKNNDVEFINQYASNHLSLSEKEVINYLSSLNQKNISENIIALLTKSEKWISKKPKFGVNRLGNNDERDDFIKNCDRFIQEVEEYNNNCREILNLAIMNKNQYLAQRVVSKAKGNISHEQHDSDYCNILVQADNRDISSIKATLQEAIRSGAFK